MITISILEDGRKLGLVVDGISYDESEIFVFAVPTSGSKGIGILLSPRGSELLEELLSRRFSDFPKETWTLEVRRGTSYQLIQSDNDITQRPTIYRKKDGDCYVRFEFYFDQANWKGLWSISEYKEEFKRLVTESEIFDELGTTEGVAGLPNDLSDKPWKFRIDEDVPLMLPVNNLDATIKEEILSHAGLLQGLHDSTEASLMFRIRRDSVVLQFQFPEEARVACEQYLLYFVQFLKDLGVEATAELQHRTTQVLFAVTPKNKEEALDKIRTALYHYLRLPMNDISAGESDIELQRLASNVYHLKSQLVLARAVLQAKDATIEAQQYHRATSAFA